jgi:8-oxo-dGTP diphosphatase
VQPTPRFATQFKSAFTVDTAIFGFDGERLHVLLVERTEAPYRHTWALPGDFVGERESLPEAAQRVLQRYTGQPDGELQQLHTFGAPDRHALGRVITIAYAGLVRHMDGVPRVDALQRRISWHPQNAVDELAFDHRQILDRAVLQLRNDFRHHPAAFGLLPKEFALSQLQKLYEAVWDTELEKRNFRKKILSTGLLKNLGRLQENVAHRPARLYRFEGDRFRKMQRDGFRLNL